MRKPFQGVWNIIRFNWHFYLMSVATVGLLLFISSWKISDNLTSAALTLIVTIISLNLNSLLVSWYIYDLSNLYSLTWLEKFKWKSNQKITNINAGFDETSTLLKEKFPRCTLTVLDFYDAKKHTEISIKRARKGYPPYTGTIVVSTEFLPLEDDTMDSIFCILSAHEIRNQNEREIFFGELARIVKPSGQIIITEHLRDLPNFLAYTFGFFHFHSRKTWLRTFHVAGLKLREEIKITRFISSFILKRHGTAS